MRSIVPVIDIGGWASGSPEQRAEIAAAVDAACRDVGFLQITGHGIPEDVIARVLVAMDEYFDLPVEEKVETSTPRPEVNRGYAAIGEESLAYSLGVEAPPDLFEASIGWPRRRDTRRASRGAGRSPSSRTAITTRS